MLLYMYTRVMSGLVYVENKHNELDHIVSKTHVVKQCDCDHLLLTGFVAWKTLRIIIRSNLNET